MTQVLNDRGKVNRPSSQAKQTSCFASDLQPLDTTNTATNITTNSTTTITSSSTTSSTSSP